MRVRTGAGPQGRQATPEKACSLVMALLTIAKIGERLTDPTEIRALDFDAELEGIELAGNDVAEVDGAEDAVDALELGEQLGVMALLVS